MKILLKTLAVLALAMLVTVGILESTGKKIQFVGLKGKLGLSQSSTYARNQVDTIIYVRELGVTKISFAARWKDSVSIMRIVAVKATMGYGIPAVAGDTVYTTFATTANTGGAIAFDYTLPILTDEYWFIVQYDTTAAKNGVTSPTSTYELISSN